MKPVVIHLTGVQRTARKRPWLAALLALAYPGLGHVYLREWARSLLWFGLALLTASLLIPPSAVPETVTLDSLSQMASTLPLTTTLALGVVTGASTVDAYWQASRANERHRQEAAGTTCPDCGRDVDEDLDFCHWCTAPLRPTNDRDA